MKISIWRVRSSTKPAKSTTYNADVRKVQIPVHHVGDPVPHHTPADLVGDPNERQEVFAFNLR
jgi:hypothetical protein